MATIQTGTIMMFKSSSMGHEQELGKILMRAFAKNIINSEWLPEKMIFLNSGAFLTTEKSEILAELKTVEQSGVEFLTCGTCLEYYELKDKLVLGRPTSQAEMIKLMGSAIKYITVT